MNERPRTYRENASRLLTYLVQRRRGVLLTGPVRIVVRDRATPLNLADPRPFDRALRAHMQAVLSRRESCSCTG